MSQMTPRQNLVLALAIAAMAAAAIVFHHARVSIDWHVDHDRFGPDVGIGADEWLLDGALGMPGTAGQEMLAAAMLVQRAHEPQLFDLPGVIGTGVGFTETGTPSIKIFVEPNTVLAALPTMLENFPVSVQTAGPFYVLPPEPFVAGGVERSLDGDEQLPNTRFDRPVPMGVSTGHTKSTAGTIGAVVTDGSQTFALSNWHVFVPAGQARVGDVLLQPGPIDGGAQPSDVIGTLSAFEPVVLTPFASNRIDAAIALTDQVMARTPDGGYGSPRSETIKAKPGLGVQKYGRTTQLTTGKVDAINTSINVSYGSAGSQVARFTGQIMVCCNFSGGGDSGSLIVAHDVDSNGNSGPNDRKPVALLFAGDGRMTIGNPIDLVLDRFGVTIVGEDSSRR